ncbi:MAG: ELM1/GtrOC1 family putative glycosyltransferase [Verrucomicrobiota bacterium]
MAQKALIVTDGKPGHENQTRALCEALGLTPEFVRVKYRVGGKALSYPLDWLGIRWGGLFRAEWSGGGSMRSAVVAPRAFRLVAGAGSTAYYPIKWLAGRMRCPSVAILAPRGYRLDFDCIVAPDYDRPPSRPNLVTVPVNLCSVDPNRYTREVAQFAALHRQERPAAGFIVGGDNSVSTLDADELEAQIRRAMQLLPEHEFWVTTSRRTPAAADEVIDQLPFDYSLVYSRTPDYNPTPAFVGACDRLFVTSDSASMISEAVCFGSAAVEILLTRQNRQNNKFLRLIRALERRGALHVFDGSLGDARAKVDLNEHLQRVNDFV